MTSGIRRGDGPPQLPPQLPSVSTPAKAAEVRPTTAVTTTGAAKDVVVPERDRQEATPTPLSAPVDDKQVRAADLASIASLTQHPLFGDAPEVPPLKGVGLTLPADVHDVTIDVETLRADAKDQNQARLNPDYHAALQTLVQSGALDALKKGG
jgi:hypothetical protein